MTIQTPLKPLPFVVFTIVLLSLYATFSLIEDTAASSQPEFSTSAISSVEPIANPTPRFFDPCPSPTRKVGNRCVLLTDAQLNQALLLKKGMVLDCRGHRLTPVSTGAEFTTPQVGIFLEGALAVGIHNCVIDGFDFGIFVVNSKRKRLPHTSFIAVKNTIKARYAAITLMAVDDAQVTKNQISYSRSAGRGLYIGRNSDSNVILGNTITAAFTAQDPPGAFRAPGPKTDKTNPLVTGSGAAVVVAQLEGLEPVLLNVVVGSRLVQLTTTSVSNNLVPLKSFSEDNRISGNRIILSTPAVDGIAMSVPQRTLLTGNRIEGRTRAGIRVGIQMGIDRDFPGTCTLSSRRCLEDAGCNLAGLDEVDSGPCKPGTREEVFWISRDTRIENNIIGGPIEVAGVSSAALGTTISGNTINGLNSPASVGIQLLSPLGLSTNIVTHNSVSGVDAAVGLVQTINQDIPPREFAAKISLNDFTGFNTAVLTAFRFPPPSPAGSFYDLVSELSVDGRGNFWGAKACPGFDPAKVRNKEDNSVNAGVTDCNSYVVPVANKTIEALPTTCRCRP